MNTKYSFESCVLVVNEVLKSTGPRMKPYGTPQVTGRQSDVTPLTIMLRARPVSQLLTHHMVCLSSCVLDSLSTRILLIQYQKLYWNPNALYQLASLDKLGGLPCHKRKLSSTSRITLMKPCWLWPVTVLCFRCFYILPRIIFSTILLVTEVRLTGCSFRDLPWV